MGDIDDDGYVDVPLPGQGIWRNIGGSGRFERFDLDAGIDISGAYGALVDCNNNGLVDVLLVGPGRLWLRHALPLISCWSVFSMLPVESSSYSP